MARFSAFFMLFHLSSTFFRPEVPFKLNSRIEPSYYRRTKLHDLVMNRFDR